MNVEVYHSASSVILYFWDLLPDYGMYLKGSGKYPEKEGFSFTGQETGCAGNGRVCRKAL